MSDARTLITILRRRLAIQVKQVQGFRDYPAPAHILYDIEDARTQIAKLKAQAHTNGEVIADDPRFEIEYVQDKEGGQDWTVEPLTPDCATPTGPCYVCGEPARQADATGPLCPDHAGVLALFEGVAVQPIVADALLAEADAALPAHPGPYCTCPDCQRATDRLVATTTMYRLICEAGLVCRQCGIGIGVGTDSQSVRPTVCGNCNGTHSIQVCPAIRQRLFAA